MNSPDSTVAPTAKKTRTRVPRNSAAVVCSSVSVDMALLTRRGWSITIRVSAAPGGLACRGRAGPPGQPSAPVEGAVGRAVAGREQRQFEPAEEPGAQCLVGGERSGQPSRGLGGVGFRRPASVRGCRRCLSPPGARCAPATLRLGGQQRAQRSRDGRIRTGSVRSRPSASARSAGPVSWYVTGPARSRTRVSASPGRGPGAPGAAARPRGGRPRARREGVGGGEGGQCAAAAGGGEGGHGHVAGLLAAQAGLVGLGLAEHGYDGDQQPCPGEGSQHALVGGRVRAVRVPGGEGFGECGVG